MYNRNINTIGCYVSTLYTSIIALLYICRHAWIDNT